MAIVTGQVEEVKDNKRFKVDGQWYGSFNAVSGVVIGDFVTINWAPDKTGQYKNIKGISKVDAPAGGGSAPAPSGGGSKDAMIIRQNALSHATALVVATGVSDVWNAQSLVLKLAEGFTKYSLTGEIEDDSPIHDEVGF
jgi:hypothetical protein